ncbi:ABC transporter permease [Streptomyces millisiae]|uniref:ABC transporter permease n=1 Tax=Streptomyces millisiae TaxID=3075542 RepID=A0ABU2LR52_9ACTN|nr:ABC transporter permease [Streptomyces sp. DSM 44918]MDT0319985.1 ABC transporter permease [Streptomyces sp. DSM 44918]
MNFVKRAALSLRSRAARTLLTFGTFAVISAMVLGGVLITSATADAGEAARRGVGAEAELGLDPEALVSGGSFQAPAIGVATLDRIGASPLVERYNYTSFNGTRLLGGAGLVSEAPLYPDAPDTYTLVHGVLDSALLPGFSDGSWRLLSGRPITAADGDRDVVLVEERLAELNGLAVGDALTLTENDPAGDHQAEFTVAGIYRDPSDEPDPEFQQLPADRLIIPATALARLNPGDGPATVRAATFQLQGPEVFEEFEAFARDTAGAQLDGFALDLNDQAVEQMTGPLESIARAATVAMWLVGVAGAAVLGLLAVLAVRQRRREFGVLLAMGERKGKLVAQQAVEVLVVAALAVVAVSAVAESLTQRAGTALLRDEAAAAQREIDAWQPPSPGSTGLGEGIDPDDAPVENADPIDEITVRLDPAALSTVVGVGLGVGLLATAIPAAAVLRLSPRAILTKGN